MPVYKKRKVRPQGKPYFVATLSPLLSKVRLGVRFNVGSTIELHTFLRAFFLLLAKIGVSFSHENCSFNIGRLLL